MTQTPEPIDLAAVQERYEAALLLVPAYGEPGDVVRVLHASAHDVPGLIAEIHRLHELLQQAHRDADELLYPPDGAHTHTREVTNIPGYGTLTFESWGPS